MFLRAPTDEGLMRISVESYDDFVLKVTRRHTGQTFAIRKGPDILGAMTTSS